MEHLYPGERAPHLVALQVADQVPFGSCPHQLVRLLPYLLGATLTQLVTTCFYQQASQGSPDILADAHQRNLLSVATAAGCRLADPLLHGRQVGCQQLDVG